MLYIKIANFYLFSKKRKEAIQTTDKFFLLYVVLEEFSKGIWQAKPLRAANMISYVKIFSDINERYYITPF